MSSVLTNGGFFEKSTSRGERRLRGRRRRGSRRRRSPRASSEGEQRGAPDHVPACLSSHSANMVKPIMIPSIQYWDRTAIRG